MSDDVQQLVTLLERWRDASGMARLNVALDASRAIRALSPTAKRELAVEVAERVAPQLVPQIRAEEGDLTPEQVSAVVDLLRRADREQLDDLVTALRTGDVDGGLALVDEALDAISPAAAAAAPAVAAAVPDDVEQAVAEADARIDRLIDDAVHGLEQGDATAEADDAPDDAAAADDRPDDAPPPPPGEVPPPPTTPALDEEAVRRAAEEAAAARAVAWRDTSTEYEHAPVDLPTVSFDIDFGDVELPDPTVEEVAPLEQRLDTLPGARATAGTGGPTGLDRSGTARPLPGEAAVVRSLAPRGGDVRPDRAPVGSLGPTPTPAVVAAITATPDGYRRRRAALAAIRDGRLAAVDVRAVVHSFARPTDRAWVAGAALDAGLLGAAGLDDLGLAPAAVRRLSRRAVTG